MGSTKTSSGKEEAHGHADPHTFFGTLLYQTILPLGLIVFSPLFLFSLLYANLNFEGSLLRVLEIFLEDGFVSTVQKIWPSVTWNSSLILASFIAFEAALVLTIPGKIHKGPLSATAHTPVYVDNGIPSFLLTMATLFGIYYFDLFPLASIYDHFSSIMSASCIFSLLFCGFLVFKGVYFPSSTDNQYSGNPIFDYFWGVELYPRFGSLDLKTLINCRVGMMSWPILLICFMLKQQELHGHISDTMYVSVFVQIIYVAKFYYWETGYFDSIDIMHDRFGFYICWGCMNWLPILYTNCSFFLVTHPIDIGVVPAILLFLAGLAAVLINYSIDEERQRFRKTNGNTFVWGKKPEYIVAEYKVSSGETKKSLLLTSGWWGLSRHLNYVAELSCALLWTPPVQFENIQPYSYFIFLLILLVHRAFRDETRCAKKYGKSYQEYKKRVPYKMIPGVF